MMPKVVAVALCLLLAGCAKQTPKEYVPQDGDFDEFELDETAESFGVIRGVVVDSTVQPIEDAAVVVQGRAETVKTNAAGAFAFKNIEPGEYFVEATKPGFKAAQTSVQVQAGELDPPVVRIRIESTASAAPYVAEDHFQGRIECSINFPVIGFLAGCLVWTDPVVGSSDRHEVVFGPAPLQWIQHELRWTPTTQTGQSLCSKIYDVVTTPAGETETVCGTSPVVRSMDQNQLEAGGLHQHNPLSFAIYPDHLLMNASGNIVVDQEFEVFSHAFHNFTPPEGWQFGRDGLPETG